MTVGELIKEIEAAGYRLNLATGTRETSFRLTLPVDMLSQEVIAAPLVLVVREPPVKEDCVFIENYLRARSTQLFGYARIEGAAATSGGVVVKLQFVTKSAAS